MINIYVNPPPYEGDPFWCQMPTIPKVGERISIGDELFVVQDIRYVLNPIGKLRGNPPKLQEVWVSVVEQYPK